MLPIIKDVAHVKYIRILQVSSNLRSLANKKLYNPTKETHEMGSKSPPIRI